MSFESVEFHCGQELDMQEALRRMVKLGFERVQAVSEPGDVALRGGVVDVFPADFELPVRVEFDGDTVATLRSFRMDTGEPVDNHDMLVVLPYFRPGAKARSLEFLALEETPVEQFVDLRRGDLAVHMDHGIGRYLGRKKLREKAGHESDHMILEYADKDRLYVPSHQAHLVQKYIGFEGKSPKLHKLGGKAWDRTKDRVRDSLRAYATELLHLQALRQTMEGFQTSADTDWQREFEESFPYEETADQIRSSMEVKRDMESPQPMDRLICGDVGYGKTEVALRAAFKVVMDNRQVAMLVPTTILAEQHFRSFTDRLKHLPINVQMLSRFRTASEQADTVKGLADGRVDMVIGTHRLFSPDVQFKNLGLVIIDEEQRFGVEHKERLKRMRLMVDILTLTATPIPRTLYMGLTGLRDLSLVNTPPEKRRPVKTEVFEDSDSILKEAFERELNRGGQTFFVHNRVKGIESIVRRVSRLVPEARVGAAHGQMPARLLEAQMQKFVRGELDILVCTTIIESGIDIPNANTLLVNRADAFGLADLYQLRGRVGRFDRQAYAYFLIPRGAVLTADSQRRLDAIQEHTDLGAGFKIAMEDMQIRGVGNLLGTEQSGHVEALGFDLYCRLLRAVVHKLKDNKAGDT
ncbi:MAG: transcription-repair coupling factor [Candidatus Omnitrophica bacterium]|nr:transcription-repair coupling factor [Candidatus Omnitrophota bacterium]